MALRAMAGLLLAFFGVAGARAQTTAQSWPDRPITFVVSNGAGSSPDVMARLLGSRLEPRLKQAVVIENRAGGSNIIGATNVSRAPPDGYRFYFATSTSLSSNVFLVKDLPYDPVKDFDPVALLLRSPQFLVTPKATPAKTLQDLIALDRQKPGAYSIATDGPRNAAGIIAQALNKAADTHFVLVNYPNIMNGLQETMAGRIEVGVFPVAIVAGPMSDGSIRAIANTSSRPLPAYPDVPLASAVLPGFDFNGWFMLMAPHGTPPDIVNRMNAAVDAAMRDPEVRALAPKLGYDIDPKGVGSPTDAAHFLDEQLVFWRKTTAELGLQAE